MILASTKNAQITPRSTTAQIQNVAEQQNSTALDSKILPRRGVVN